MPFSGGGGGALTNHVHDSTPLQGGPLSFNGTTIGGMSAGDITYSDGAALQTLTYPAVPAGETLQAVALSTAPSWAAAAPAASTFEFVASQTLAVSATEIDITFPSISGDDISQLMCVYVGGFDANSEAHLQINGINSGYYTFGTHSNNGISPNGVVYAANQVHWVLTSNLSGGDFRMGTSTFFLRCGNSLSSPASSSEASFSGTGSDGLPNAGWALQGSLDGHVVNSFDQVRVFAGFGATQLTAGSKLTIYRMNSS